MRHLALVSCLCSLVWLSASPAHSADWPQWLGPNHNGVSVESVAPWKETPKALWKHKAGASFSSPIVASGTVFVHGLGSGKDAEEVLALDAETGAQRWHDTYKRAPYRSQLGAGPRATPTFAKGLLFTYGITGTLRCYDGATGKRRWQVNPYEANKLSLPRYGVCSSPIVAGGRAIVLVGGAGAAVAAYDIESGKQAWKALDEPAGSASPTVLPASATGKGEEIVVQTTLRLVGLDPKDGSIHWEQPLVFEPSGVSPTPFVVGDVLICTTQDSGTLAVGLPGKTAAAPKMKWRKTDLSGYFSTGTLGPDGTILVVTNALAPLPRADLRCLDPTTGNEIWHKDNLGYFHFGVVSVAGEKVLILDDAGNLILARVTRKGYEQLAKSKVCRGTFNSPAVANGRVYVRDNADVICLQLDSSAKSVSNSR